MSLISHSDNDELAKFTKKAGPKIVTSNIAQGFEYWINLAKERIFSLAAGNRIGAIAPKIMEIGYGKVLYAATQMGADIHGSKSFIFFAPDGTCSYNPIRTQRGFSYGGILDMEFDGIIATNNSMPNGCGFSMFEIVDPIPDTDLISYLQNSQQRLGQEQISELGKGNHFAGVYRVQDPITGEDTNRRFVVVHCSGHVGGNRLYHPDSWLDGVEGYYDISTPHGNITLLEGDAKSRYQAQFEETNQANATNRDITIDEIFPDMATKKLEEITHQGFVGKNSTHIIGTQVHKGMMPIAFNPEEGLIAVTTNPNLSSEFLDTWKFGEKARTFGLVEKFKNLNVTPHGGGYEFRQKVNSCEIRLGSEGIHDFKISLQNHEDDVSFTYFKEIRHLMTYRRRSQIMKEVNKANLADIEFDLPGLMQVYPLVSIPGGSH